MHRWLAVLARYLDHNAVSGRSLGGRPLPSTDIVPHELWPLAGFRRPRVVALAILAAVWLVAVSIVWTHVPGEASAWQFPAAGGALFIFLAAWSDLWPPPHRLNFGQIRTRDGRRRLAGGLGLSGIALAILCALGAVLGIVFLGGLGGVLTGYPVGGLLFGLTIGLGFDLTVVPAVVLASGLVDETDIRTQGPRSIIRDDLAFVLAVMLMLGLTVILPIRLMGEIMGGFALLLVLGGLANLVSEIGFGMAGFRYLALLLCTRRWSEYWLPWRLGRFLTMCYQAGLVRIAGNGYQFRHRELQDYLAHQPVP